MIVGVIGYKNHSKKIIEILIKNKNIKEIKVYCYKNFNFAGKYFNSSKIRVVFNIEDLDLCQAIFITSPTKTHLYYLKIFTKLNKYIFCEKPGGNSLESYNFLKKLDIRKKRKIYFNYNLLFSKTYKILKKYICYKKYGKLISVNIKYSNGLSFKKEFKNNWRFVSSNIFDNITGNLGSHYINILFNLFSNLNKLYITVSSTNLKNDTCYISLENKFIKIFIYLSYSSVLNDEIILNMTNANILLRNDYLKILYPRDVFDKCGDFIYPKEKKIKKLNQKNDYYLSNIKSINFFITSVKNKKNISNKIFENSLKTIKFFL
jgi:predicted dehydrogenase